MVEAGLIDQAHHRGWANRAISETLALEQAVNDTLQILDERDALQESLVLVTADHSHTLSISGYPNWEDDIRGEFSPGNLLSGGFGE